MDNKNHCIRLHNVLKQFSGMEKPALATLNGEIRPGAVTGLLGPDGAGKTTLLRILAGLLRPDNGQVRVFGFDPLKNNHALHHLLGYMPQKFGLYEDLTVQENLNLYAELRGIHRQNRQSVFQRLLEFTALSPFTRRLAGKLSGGMKQKLGLACTLVGQPQVLLLDEPGVGVDPISRRELWRMVDELANSGMLILWSTSYLDEAERCRDVWLLNDGQLLYQGAPDALTRRLNGRCWLVTSSSVSNRQLLRQLISLPEVSDSAIQGRSVRIILTEQVKIDALLQHKGIQNIHCTLSAPHFEDAFIDLLGGGVTTNSLTDEFLHTLTTSTSDIVIEARNLTKKFASFTATCKVNFQVRRGEIFGLLGPNGAGKSTTFKIMCGLLTASDGEAQVLGTSLKSRADKIRNRIGYMAQKFSLYGNLTVEQNLRFFSGIYGLSGKIQQEKIRQMVRAFSLQPIINQSADKQPPGFRQRLALACALMHQPEILFLDEPTSGVDPLTRREFWLHINRLVEKGVTVMVTTHFMDEAEYCDRIGLIYHGQLIASGTPDELKQQTASSFCPDPTMEQAFIHLIAQWDKEHPL